tara:strand:+ start:232 stop:429 length:198 start_codon:yes stop_codon:yes gene_type:complete
MCDNEKRSQNQPFRILLKDRNPIIQYFAIAKHLAGKEPGTSVLILHIHARIETDKERKKHYSLPS